MIARPTASSVEVNSAPARAAFLRITDQSHFSSETVPGCPVTDPGGLAVFRALSGNGLGSEDLFNGIQGIRSRAGASSVAALESHEAEVRRPDRRVERQAGIHSQVDGHPVRHLRSPRAGLRLGNRSAPATEPGHGHRDRGAPPCRCDRSIRLPTDLPMGRESAGCAIEGISILPGARSRSRISIATAAGPRKHCLQCQLLQPSRNAHAMVQPWSTQRRRSTPFYRSRHGSAQPRAPACIMLTKAGQSL